MNIPVPQESESARSVGERVSGSGDQDVSDQNDQFGMLAPQAAIAWMVVWLTRTS